MVHGNINCLSNKVTIEPYSLDGFLAVVKTGTAVAGATSTELVVVPKESSDSDIYTWQVAKKGSNKFAFKNLKTGKWISARDWFWGKKVVVNKGGSTEDLGSWEYFRYAGGDCGMKKYAGTFALETAHDTYLQMKAESCSRCNNKLKYTAYQKKLTCGDEARFSFKCID